MVEIGLNIYFFVPLSAATDTIAWSRYRDAGARRLTLTRHHASSHLPTCVYATIGRRFFFGKSMEQVA